MRAEGKATIDGVNYTAGHWSVDKANTILARLIKLLGEPMAEVVMGLASGKEEGGGVSGVMDTQMSELAPKIAEKLGPALRGLSGRLDEKVVQTTMREICGSDLLADGKQLSYDSHFMGRIGHMYRVALFVLKHQYADFLGESPGASA